MSYLLIVPFFNEHEIIYEHIVPVPELKVHFIFARILENCEFMEKVGISMFFLFLYSN